jgi:hypothetical protein
MAMFEVRTSAPQRSSRRRVYEPELRYVGLWRLILGLTSVKVLLLAVGTDGLALQEAKS